MFERAIVATQVACKDRFVSTQSIAMRSEAGCHDGAKVSSNDVEYGRTGVLNNPTKRVASLSRC